MASISIRLRLTIWYAAVLLAGLVVFGAVLWLGLKHRLLAEVDAQLDQEIDGMRTVLVVEGSAMTRQQMQKELAEFAREIRDGAFIQLHDDAGATVLPFPDRPLLPPDSTSDQPQFRTETWNGHTYRLLTGRLEYQGQTYHALVASPLDEVQGTLAKLLNLLLLMIPAVLAAACLGGYWISRRALDPVDDITRVAKSISVHNLSERLAVPQTGDELQRMSETWNQVLERLDNAVMRIRKFTADASHELRTPVALIRATAELALRRDRDAAEYRQALHEIEQEAEAMTSLTESLLTLARDDAGGLELALSATDLNLVVEEAVRQNQSLAQAKGISLQAVPAVQPATAMANEAGIRRVLFILIDNALKHTPKGGAVTASVEPRGESVVLAVKDNGEGIATSALPHIFERFYRADSARGGEGAGLGLSIAQAIAKAHGSVIEAHSKPGEGALFELNLKSCL